MRWPHRCVLCVWEQGVEYGFGRRGLRGVSALTQCRGGSLALGGGGGRGSEAGVEAGQAAQPAG
jgi:hypothetical protein